jgi:polyisoprenoid-binding protein YceI
MRQFSIASAPRLIAAVVAVLALFSASSQVLAQTPGTWVIDSSASEVHWRIYKAGAFARFGHNHVVSIAEPSGTIEVAPDLSDSVFELTFDVAQLSIDDPQLRARYGEDFESVPTPEDIAGTRTNMLTEQVLNGEVYPSISVKGTDLSGLGEDQTIVLTISLLGRSVEITVPVTVSFEESGLHARSQFRLMHEDLGMEPFSVMMGALQVAPEIDFTVDILARLRAGSD